MSYFLFNGVSSNDLGLIITKPIVRPSWAREIAEQTAPGRTAKIMQQSTVYGNADFTIQAVIADAEPENVRQIYQALNGPGVLQISTAPAEYLDVYIQALVPEAVALLMAELPISVTALPFAKAVEPTVVDLSGASQNTLVPNPGTVYSEPEIRFTATGDQVTIYVNGKPFIVELTANEQGREVIIDCEAEVTYYVSDGGQKVSINSQTRYDYPLLHTGDNYIYYDGSVSAMSCCVRERWL